MYLEGECPSDVGCLVSFKPLCTDRMILYRIGSSLVKWTTINPSARVKPTPTVRRERPVPTRNQDPPRPGFGRPTTPLVETPRVPSARRSLNRPGPRTSRTGSGKMPSKWALGCTTRVVTPRSPRGVPSREAPRRRPKFRRGRGLPTRCWASARPRRPIRLVRLASRPRGEPDLVFFLLWTFLATY